MNDSNVVGLAGGMVVRGLAGQHAVHEPLGRGGFGRTFLGADEQGREVVLKQLHFARLPDWKSLDLFAREATVLAQLSHPRVPRLVP